MTLKSFSTIMRAFFCGLFFLAAVGGSAATFNVREFGAKADHTNNDASAIQAAIDGCNQSGGGEVVVPAGNYFAGKIVLKSNVTLKLENGATIWASGNIEDYEKNPTKDEHGYWCVATNAENIAIAGDGKIVGTGQAELGRREDENKTPLPAHRFGIIHFSNCKNVRLRDFGILFSEAHAVVFNECQDVFMNGVSILNNFLRTNTDGIDPISCTNVFISNCHIVAGDDCICPKTEKGIPLENLVVENCILESIAGAVKLGTGSSGDFRDIKVSNCVIRNSGVGIGLFIKDGGTVERASFSNISIETTSQDTPINARLRNNIIPIYIDLGKRNPDSLLSHIRDVSFSDIQIESDNSIVIQGMPERAIENLTMRNISFRMKKAFDFSARTKREGGKSTYKDENNTRYVRQPACVALAYVNGLTVDNVRVTIDENVFKQFDRSALAIFNSQNGVVQNVRREPLGKTDGQPVVAFSNCTQMFVTGCFAPPGTPVFLGLSGEKTKEIHLAGNDLKQATMPVMRSKEVSSSAVQDAAAQR
jgi:polygalacturonase